MALTSPFLGTVGTMSAYLAMVSPALPRALSSTSGDEELNYGSSKAFADEG